MMGGASANKVAGYTHALYAQSLAEFGTPLELPSCGGWILKRRIPGYPNYDGMGCYPLFACQDWALLEADLENIGSQLVSLAIVADPFGRYSPAYLERCFQDVVIPFKEHFVIDLGCPPDTFVSEHHRRNARKAFRALEVERCARPTDFLGDWTTLYRTLIERHNITGIAAFSKDAFAKQLSVPGMMAFRAVHSETTVGMLLWYAQGDKAYYHLGAYNLRGYELHASFALFAYSINYFAKHGFTWINLGAGAGAGISGASGLGRFKQGWSTGVRTTYFCGRIFNDDKYKEIVKVRNVTSTKYFPAYRVGEFR